MQKADTASDGHREYSKDGGNHVCVGSEGNDHNVDSGTSPPGVSERCICVKA